MIEIKGFKNNLYVCILYLKNNDIRHVVLSPSLDSFNNEIDKWIDFIYACTRENIEIVEFVPCRVLKANNPKEIDFYHLLQKYNIKADWKKFKKN